MDDKIPADGAAAPDGEQEAGEPITSLRDLEHDTSPFFLRKIRTRIYRRTAASQLLLAWWELPWIVLTELTSMLTQVFIATTRKGN